MVLDEIDNSIQLNFKHTNSELTDKSQIKADFFFDKKNHEIEAEQNIILFLQSNAFILIGNNLLFVNWVRNRNLSY